MPKISVIVPVYNVEKYINRCVQSILNQSFSDFELILVDDGSPDTCPELCDEWAYVDSRIRVIHKKNGGLSAARNAGISMASGEYFLFVDSDDMIHPDCLKILMTCIQNTGAEIALGRFTKFQGNVVSTDFRSISGNESIQIKSNLETLDCLFEDIDHLPSLVSACGKLWHRSLFANIIFPIGRLFEDEFTTYKLYHQAKMVVFANIELYFYFVNDTGITQNLTLEKRFDEYDAQWERIKYFSQQNLSELLGKACIFFLRTAQWDLIECRNHASDISSIKKKKLERQYYRSFRIAKKMRLLNFLKDYDYYVLAAPRYSLFLRIKRQILFFSERLKL